MKSLKLFAIALTVAIAGTFSSSACHAQIVEITGGQISIDLDTDSMGELAGIGLTFTGATNNVRSDRGGDFIGFDINPREGMPSPLTTFAFEASDLTTAEGTVETLGTIGFSLEAGFLSVPLSFGNFQIGFDDVRVGGSNSGFFGVSNTSDFEGVVFDISNQIRPIITDSSFTFEGDIFVSEELATLPLLAGAVAGTRIGTIAIDATVTAIPEPTSVGCIAILGIATALRRRRKSLI